MNCSCPCGSGGGGGPISSTCCENTLSETMTVTVSDIVGGFCDIFPGTFSLTWNGSNWSSSEFVEFCAVYFIADGPVLPSTGPGTWSDGLSFLLTQLDADSWDLYDIINDLHYAINGWNGGGCQVFGGLYNVCCTESNSTTVSLVCTGSPASCSGFSLAFSNVYVESISLTACNCSPFSLSFIIGCHGGSATFTITEGGAMFLQAQRKVRPTLRDVLARLPIHRLLFKKKS